MQQWIEEALLVEPRSLTGEALKKIMPRCPEPDAWADAIGPRLVMAGIESNHDIAMFLAHMGHESADLTRLEESLYYSTAERLMQVWPTRFKTLGYAETFARNPTDLANLVYGGRMGNVEPGDGWKYRGRGPFQLTGRDNYARCAEATGLDLVNDPDALCRDPVAGTVSALWFWSSAVTGRDMRTTTRQVNGGYHGLSDRIARFRRTLDVLEGRV